MPAWYISHDGNQRFLLNELKECRVGMIDRILYPETFKSAFLNRGRWNGEPTPKYEYKAAQKCRGHDLIYNSWTRGICGWDDQVLKPRSAVRWRPKRVAKKRIVSRPNSMWGVRNKTNKLSGRWSWMLGWESRIVRRTSNPASQVKRLWMSILPVSRSRNSV